MSDSESGLDDGDGHSRSDDDDDDHSSHSSLVFDSDEERWSKNSFTDSPLNSMFQALSSNKTNKKVSMSLNRKSAATAAGSLESDDSFLDGGKCDLKTGKCTAGRPAPRGTLTTFLGILSQNLTARNSFASKKSGKSGRQAEKVMPRERNGNINGASANDRLLVRVAHWLDDYKGPLLIGGGLAVAIYLVASGNFKKLWSGRQKPSPCQICEICQTRSRAACR